MQIQFLHSLTLLLSLTYSNSLAFHVTGRSASDSQQLFLVYPSRQHNLTRSFQLPKSSWCAVLHNFHHSTTQSFSLTRLNKFSTFPTAHSTTISQLTHFSSFILRPDSYYTSSPHLRILLLELLRYAKVPSLHFCSLSYLSSCAPEILLLSFLVGVLFVHFFSPIFSLCVIRTVYFLCAVLMQSVVVLICFSHMHTIPCSVFVCLIFYI